MALQGVDFLVETIPEKLEIKQAFFREIEPKVGAEVVLASNTSGIPITQLAEATEVRGRVIGMHWSNPPHIIPVIEVIRGIETADATVAATHAVINSIEMIPVDVLRDVPGFVENRILYAIMREALYLVEQGVATPDAVDEICPAPITDEQTRVLIELGLKAHKVLGCRDFSRTDIMWSEDGPVLLETNTIPGLTPASLFPKSAEAAGIDFADLVAGLVENARKRGA